MKTSLCVTIGVVVVASFMLQSCDIAISRTKAMNAKKVLEIKRLLVAMEQHQQTTSVLPSTLDELRNADERIKDIDLSGYRYDAKGITLSDGSVWLILTSDAVRTGDVIVGRLPVEVTQRSDGEQRELRGTKF